MTIQKIALITGGSRGLGKATALALAGQGVDVILTYRSKEREAKAVVATIEGLGRKAAAFQLDTGLVGGFDAFANEVGGALDEKWDRTSFDILVNNAGFAVVAPFEQTTEADFDNLVNVHFKGVFFLTQKLLPLLADGGSIVNYSSGLTRFVGDGQAAYASMKGAIEVLTRYQAKELGARGIRVNVIAPGPTATDFSGGVMQSEQFRTAMGSRVALGRIGEPEDIGDAIASLVSDGSRWITAQRIEASGGTLL
jgi:NAD(P)-dependent dehydrogenase (short-subunit alcohol dehydrogenase family)